MNGRTRLRVVIDAMAQRAGKVVSKKPFLEAVAMEDMHALEFTDFVFWQNRLQAHDTDKMTIYNIWQIKVSFTVGHH